MAIDDRRDHRALMEVFGTPIAATASTPDQSSDEIDGALAQLSKIQRDLAAASSITICGVAPPSLIEALQRAATVNAETGEDILQWREITYITPAPALVFATRGDARLGAVVQRWEAGIYGLRNCVWQVREETQRCGQPSVAFTILGTPDLFLDVTVMITDHATRRRKAWTSLAPNLSHAETLYACFDEGTEAYARIDAAVQGAGRRSMPLVSRQAVLKPNGLAEACGTGGCIGIPELKVASLDDVGSKGGPDLCLPAVLTVVRTQVSGDAVVVLERRSRYTAAEDFDKLSLLSARILQEDWLHGIGLDVPDDLDPANVIDRVWKHCHHRELRLESFVKAAQRDLYANTGRDIAEDRFRYLGCHFVPMADRASHFFCVFALALERVGVDELELAKQWNRNLVVVPQEELYSPAHQLNHFLQLRRDWMEKSVLSEDVFPSTPSPAALPF